MIITELFTNPKKIAESFNKYYTSVANDILNKRKYVGTDHHTDFLKNLLETTFAVYECDQSEIENIISSLNPKKVTGPNSLPCYPFSLIFNMSFTTGVYPDLLKTAKTIPIYKKGSKLCTSNYRPISILSNLYKILEKLIFNRFNRFLDDKHCIYNLQFGFRKKYSINHTLIEITEYI